LSAGEPIAGIMLDKMIGFFPNKTESMTHGTGIGHPTIEV
jgi:hypothetical protein